MRNFQNPSSMGSIVAFALQYVSSASLVYRRAPSMELIFLWNGNLACFSMCSHISFMAPTVNS